MKFYRCASYPTAYHGRVITPDIFVWHSTHGGAKAWLDMLFSGRTTNGGNKITVHFAIYKDGDCVEYAPWKPGEAVACWHAGLSEWDGRTSANFFSLGCEIQHAPGEDFTVGQLEAIEYLTRMVQAEYPAMRHTTHKFISGRLQGKSDPYSPQWESQAWPMVQAALESPEGDDMADPQVIALLTEIRDLLYTTRYEALASASFRDAIGNALRNDDKAEATRLNAEMEKAGFTNSGFVPPR
jgi:hypothetical protein